MAADSLMDDQSSVNSFMEWAKTMIGSSRSPASDETLNKDPKTPAVEPQQGQPTFEGSTQNVGSAQENKSLGIPKVAAPTSLQALVIKHEDKRKTIEESEAVPSENNLPYEGFVQSPVVSIAHKATKPSATPVSKLTSANKLDCSPEDEPQRSLASMTSTQRKILQKLDPKHFEEHQDPLPNPFEKQHLQERKSEAIPKLPIQDTGTVPGRKTETISQQQNIGSMEPKQGNGLVDSIHARPTNRGLQSRMLPGRQYQQSFPPTGQGSSPVRMEDGKHDPMEYFDTKRKEYYPVPGTSGNGPKAMLQSKDPNVSLRSPKKSVAKLDPQAKEYIAAKSAPKLVEEATETRDEGIPLDSADRKEEVEPVVAASETKDELVTTASQPKITKDVIDEVGLPKAEQAEKVTKVAKGDPAAPRESSQAESGFDLTPMLNVLGARTVKTPETPPSGNIDSKPAAMAEKDEPSVVSVTQVLTEQDAREYIASRALVMKNLPDNSDYTLVQSVIDGATIMSMKLMQDKNCAQVKLTDVDDCQKFIDSSKNGVEIKHHGTMYKVLIEPLPEVGEDNELLEVYLDCGATRAVQAEGVDLDLTMRTLYQLASGPTSLREVEGINDSFSAGVRKVMFRFTSIQDAVAFRSSLRRDVDWKTKNIEFVKDPCA